MIPRSSQPEQNSLILSSFNHNFAHCSPFLPPWYGWRNCINYRGGNYENCLGNSSLFTDPQWETFLLSLFLVNKTHVEGCEGGGDTRRRRSDATFAAFSILPLNSLFSHSSLCQGCIFNRGQSNHSESFISTVYTGGGEVCHVSLPLSETPDVARHPTPSFAITRLC